MTIAVHAKNKLEPFMIITEEERALCERAVKASLAYHNADAQRGQFGTFDSFIVERAQQNAAKVERFFLNFPHAQMWKDLAGESFHVLYNAVADCSSSPNRGIEIVNMEPDPSCFDRLQLLLADAGQRYHLF